MVVFVLEVEVEFGELEKHVKDFVKGRWYALG